MSEETELLIRKNALKDVETWLYKQYQEIDEKLLSISSALNDSAIMEEGYTGAQEL